MSNFSRVAPHGAYDFDVAVARCAGRFADLLAVEPSAGAIAALRATETIGRPLGPPAFLDRLAALTGRGPKPRAGVADEAND